MKARFLAVSTALAVLFTAPLISKADVTSLTLNSPTTASPVNADAGYTFTANISYTANNSGGSPITVTLKLLSGNTIIGQTNYSVTKQVPGGSANLVYYVANCAPNGTYALAAEATETTTLAVTNADAVILTSGQPIAFTVTGGGAYCSGGSGVPVGLSGSEFGVNYQLKRGAINNGSPVAGTGGPISFGNKVFPATYTVVAVDAVSGCSATMSGSAVVSVNSPSVGGTATATESALCNGSSTTISLSGQTGNIVEWQYSTDGGGTWSSIASTNNPLTTSALTTNTYFQAVVLNDGCTAAYSSPAGVTVYPASVGGTATPSATPLCSGSSTTITLSGQTGSILKWQSSTNGTDWTDIPSTANPLNTGNLTASKQFRAVVQSGSCSAANSSVATVTVSPATVPGTATALAGTICNGTSTSIQLNDYTGSIVRWESSLDGISWSPIASTSATLNTGNLTTNTQFRAMVQSGGCNLLDSVAATVSVTPASVGGTATPASATLCNGSATTVTLSGQVGTIVKWQTSTNGSDWSDIPSTANPLNTGSLSVTHRYRAVVLSGSCNTANSAEAIVTVYTAPSISGQPASLIKLIGESATFSVTATNATAYQWRTNGVSLAGANASTLTINPVSATDALSYDVVVFGESPCSTVISAAATLSVGSKLVFTSEPVGTTAGATLSAVVVQVQDAAGNNIARSGVSITIALNGAGASLNGTTTANTDASGAATFSDLSLVKAGTGYTLTASAGSLTPATSGVFSISAATASAYRLSTVSPTLTPATPTALTLRLVDPFTNTVTSFTGDKNLTFAGISIANNGTTHPTVSDKTGAAINFGTATTVRFTNGICTLGGTLLAYKAEGPVALSATDGTLSTATTGGTGATVTVTNAPALAGVDNANRGRNTQLRLTIANLLTNDTDANRDLIQFAGVVSPSAEGATLVANSSFILYSMPSGTNPPSDSFSYLITDGTLTSTGIVSVALLPEPTGTNFSLISSVLDTQSHPVLTFAGVPGYNYKVQRSQNLSTWVDLFTTNMPALGKFQFTDTNPSNPAFYRAINQ